MSLAPGQSLLHYRIVGKIGEGGMGAVWEALDTTLDRKVAIKVLPAQFAADNERLVRFEREAKLLASLSHPNIAGVYGLHAVDDVRFLAMELVQGEDLQKRLAKGPLAMDDALDVAAQVARALEAAYAQGIVHRDLKPANIVRSDDGVIKVLDFGLAKALASDPASGEADPSLSPTMTSAGTVAGMILGTAAYMSPEQARGRSTDVRADLWAYGATLMEMITGKQVFVGETVSDILAAVLKSEPDWESLPDATPRAVRRLLRRCLRKDPDSRLHHPADARIEIEAAKSQPDPVESVGGEAAAPADEAAWKRALPWVLAPLALVAVLTLAAREFSRPEPQSAAVSYRFDIGIQAGGQTPVVSPDGRRFAYAARLGDAGGIFIRSFSEQEGRALDGVVLNTRPGLMWSADGSSLAFFLEDTLERIRVDGGTPQTMCKVPRGRRGGSWSSSGTVLFELTDSADESAWYACRPDTPVAERIERPLPLESGQIRAHPAFLPDGEHYVFVQHVDGVRQAVLARLGSTDVTLMFPTDTKVGVAADGWYLFSRQGQLLARPFDPASYLPLGEPVKVADRVDLFEPNGRASFSVSNQGTVMYRTGEEISEIVWFDRNGRELSPAVGSGEYQENELSPDGRLLALVINDPRTGTGDLWVHDLERGSANRLTSTAWAEFSPKWSPDSTEIVFSADPVGPPNVYIIGVDGGEPREIVAPSQNVHYPSDWSNDGKTILFERTDARTGYDLWAVDATGGEPRELIRTDHYEADAVVSPDRRWFAYTSRDTGRSEVYIQPYGRDGSRQRVSIDTGWLPQWDGDERLFFRSTGEKLMSVTLRPDGARLAIGQPETVVAFDGGDMGGYCLHPDGRILITRHQGQNDVTPIEVVVGWK